MCALIYWNPLYEVSVSDSAVSFCDERGRFTLARPPSLPDWGIVSSLVSGLSGSIIGRATDIEKAVLRMLANRNLIVELPFPPESLKWERSAGHYLTFHTAPMVALERLRNSVVCFIFSPADIGKVKVEAAEVFIRARIDEAKVIKIRQYIDSTRTLDGLSLDQCSIIVHCFDSPRLASRLMR